MPHKLGAFCNHCPALAYMCVHMQSKHEVVRMLIVRNNNVYSTGKAGSHMRTAITTKFANFARWRIHILIMPVRHPRCLVFILGRPGSDHSIVLGYVPEEDPEVCDSLSLCSPKL